MNEESMKLLLVAGVPITFDAAIKIWGDPDVNLCDDTTRRCFFAVWAMAQSEYADAVINQLKKAGGEG